MADTQEEKLPKGLTARPNALPITFPQFFDLLRLADAFSHLMIFLKNENINNDNLRYYFEEDVVKTTNEKGELVETLREDFWGTVEEVKTEEVK